VPNCGDSNCGDSNAKDLPVRSLREKQTEGDPSLTLTPVFINEKSLFSKSRVDAVRPSPGSGPAADSFSCSAYIRRLDIGRLWLRIDWGWISGRASEVHPRGSLFSIFQNKGKPWLLPTISIGKVKRAREEKRIWAPDSVSKKLQRRRFSQTAPELLLFGQLL
jgi:hypothetical protein